MQVVADRVWMLCLELEVSELPPPNVSAGLYCLLDTKRLLFDHLLILGAQADALDEPAERLSGKTNHDREIGRDVGRVIQSAAAFCPR